jgi:hypothetical protein
LGIGRESFTKERRNKPADFVLTGFLFPFCGKFLGREIKKQAGTAGDI